MKKAKMKELIAALREQIVEREEILSGVEDTVELLPYWELNSGRLEIDEETVTDRFQWFRSWMIRNGLSDEVSPAQPPLSWCDNLASTGEEKVGRMHLDCPVIHTDRGPTFGFGSEVMICDNLPDDDHGNPRLDGHHDGEGYDHREDR